MKVLDGKEPWLDLAAFQVKYFIYRKKRINYTLGGPQFAISVLKTIPYVIFLFTLPIGGSDIGVKHTMKIPHN